MDTNGSNPEHPQQQPIASLEQFQFTGSGVQFFKIWIVNLLLSIVTLGIYTPWAKVRTYRYFYGNTWLAGNNFEYHADPVRILIGRIIAVVFFICYSMAGSVHPLLGAGFGLALFVLVPWVVVNSIRFNAVMSSYRGIRFNFRGTYGEAAVSFLLWPIAGVLSLGLLFPLALYKQANYNLSNHTIGKTPFYFSASAKEYYLAVVVCLAVGILSYAAVWGLVDNSVLEAFGSIDEDNPPHPGAILWMIGLFYAPLLLPFLVYKGITYNIVMNNLSAGGNQAQSRLSVINWVWIVLSNTALILCTLGLYYPWARVRAARYKAAVSAVRAEDLSSFLADEASRQTALGDEIGQAFDVGVGV